MAFVSVHGSITAATVNTTASIVGQYTRLVIANAGGGGDLWFRLDGTAAASGATSARAHATTGTQSWDLRVARDSVILPASVTTNVSLISNVTNTAYSITGY